MDPVSTRLLDRRYRITNVLTQHSHESHYAARHVELDIPVRIITLDLSACASPAPCDASITRLWAQAACAAGLRHPSLVRVRDCFRHRSAFSIVTEEVPGETLAVRLARQGGLSLRETLTYGLQLCDLLAYVAREGAALTPLRSITPESLVIQDDSHIVLTDLGIGGLMSKGVHVYAPSRLPYLAPEILMGAAADIRADVYSIAAVLYAALAGEAPAPFGLGLLPLCALAPLAPGALGDTLERALQPDPAARFASPDDFGRALGRSVRTTMPAVAALARQQRRRPTGHTVVRTINAAPTQEKHPSAPAPPHTTRRPHSKRWPRAWAHEISRIPASRPLRRTGERALAALSSALRLGAYL